MSPRSVFVTFLLLVCFCTSSAVVLEPLRVRHRRSDCSLMNYLPLAGVFTGDDLVTKGTACQALATQAAATEGPGTFPIELVSCNSPCYDIALTMFDAFANLNCDIQLSTLSQAIGIIGNVLPKGFDIQTIVDLAAKNNITEITHANLQTGDDYLKSLCTTMDGTTMTCAQELVALQNSSDPQHDAMCTSMSFSCSTLVKQVVAYGKLFPLIDPYISGFDLNDLRKNCNGMTMSPTSPHAPTPPTAPWPDTTPGPPRTRPNGPRPSPSAPSPPPPTFDYPPCEQGDITSAMMGADLADTMTCANSMGSDDDDDSAQMAAADAMLQCGTPCMKAFTADLGAVAALGCDLQLQTIADMASPLSGLGGGGAGAMLPTYVASAKAMGFTEITNGQLVGAHYILEQTCVKIPGSDLTCLDEIDAAANKTNPLHAQLCTSMDQQCKELVSVMQDYVMSLPAMLREAGDIGDVNIKDKVSENCSTPIVFPDNVPVPWHSDTVPTPVPNSVGGYGSVIVPAVIGAIVGGAVIVIVVFLLLKRRGGRRGGAVVYQTLEHEVDPDINEMVNMSGMNDSVVSGGLSLNDDAPSQHSYAYTPQPTYVPSHGYAQNQGAQPQVFGQSS